jgi:hypothetical protein
VQLVLQSIFNFRFKGLRNVITVGNVSYTGERDCHSELVLEGRQILLNASAHKLIARCL